MNWEVIAALAELLGAIGVILTLVYLAFQIRQNTRAIKGQTLSNVTQNVFTELVPFVGENIGPIWLKAITDPDQLTNEENGQLDAWMIGSFQSRQNEFTQYKLGALDESVWKSMHRPIEENLGNPYGRKWWRELGRPRLMPEFVEFVEGLNWHEKDTKVFYQDNLTSENDT